jgi:DNA-binding LytR/AlgR family response regulator
MIKCIIIDDDKTFTEVLKHYVEQTGFLQLTGCYFSAVSALKSGTIKDADIAFLDIEMPEMTGIELLGSISDMPPVIIVSSKKDYGVEAFEHNTIDYLHKPISYARFMKAAEKAKKIISSEKKVQDCFYIRNEGMWIKLSVQDICHVKADNDYVIIYTENEKYRVHKKMKDLLEKLPSDYFMQIHRSYLVQLSKISKIDGEVIEVNKRTLPVSKTHIQELHNRLNLI